MRWSAMVALLVVCAGCEQLFAYQPGPADVPLLDGDAGRRVDGRLRNDVLPRDAALACTPPGQCSTTLKGFYCNPKAQLEASCSRCGCLANQACCVDESCSPGQCDLVAYASADTYVLDSQPDKNYGKSPELRVSGAVPDLADSYLRFNVQSLATREIVGAWLYLHVLQQDLPFNVQIGVIDIPWDEATLIGSAGCDQLYTCAGPVTVTPLAPGNNHLPVRDRVSELLKNSKGTGLFVWRPVISLGEARLASKEHATAAYWPSLHVTYR